MPYNKRGFPIPFQYKAEPKVLTLSEELLKLLSWCMHVREGAKDLLGQPRDDHERQKTHSQATRDDRNRYDRIYPLPISTIKNQDS